MKLRIYRVFDDVEDLTDQQRVFLWFITTMLREVGWQETLTMDSFDYRRLLFGNKKGALTTRVAFPKNLRKYFNVGFVGNDRVIISLSDTVHEMVDRIPGPKNQIGHIWTEVNDLPCQKIVIYLSALFNNIDTLLVSEEEGGKYGLLIDKKSRFRKSNEGHYYTQHDRFSFDQFFYD